MNVIRCDDYDSLSARGAGIVMDAIRAHPKLLLCAASGRSPLGLYAALAKAAEADRASFAGLRVVNLDEWGGIPEGGPGSSEAFLRSHLLDPLGVPSERFIRFASHAAEPERECERVRSELAQQGPIDMCVLGLGVNGHLGFNEPGASLVPQCHVAVLSADSRRHSMVSAMSRIPQFGLTLGMREILASKQILLLVSGEGKERAITGLLAGTVTTALPASFLWLHEHVECLIDQSAVPSSDA